MNAKYYKEDDLLVLKLSNRPFKAAQKLGSFIVHYDVKEEPVLIEVLNASKLLRATSKALPRSLVKNIFSVA